MSVLICSLVWTRRFTRHCAAALIKGGKWKTEGVSCETSTAAERHMNQRYYMILHPMFPSGNPYVLNICSIWWLKQAGFPAEIFFFSIHLRQYPVLPCITCGPLHHVDAWIPVVHMVKSPDVTGGFDLNQFVTTTPTTTSLEEVAQVSLLAIWGNLGWALS